MKLKGKWQETKIEQKVPQTLDLLGLRDFFCFMTSLGFISSVTLFHDFTRKESSAPP